MSLMYLIRIHHAEMDVKRRSSVGYKEFMPNIKLSRWVIYHWV